MENIRIFECFNLDVRTSRVRSMRKNNSLIQSPENIQHLKFKNIYIGSEYKEGVVKKTGRTTGVEVDAIATKVMWEICLKLENQLYSKLLRVQVEKTTHRMEEVICKSYI